MNVAVSREHQIRQAPVDWDREKRNWMRLECDLATELADTGGHSWNCSIVDMCASGLGIITDARLARGDAASIVDPRLNVVVVWVRPGKAGLRIVSQQ